MEIITGYRGKPHVTSEQDRDVNIGVVGEGSYVLQTGMQLAAEVSSNNEIKIRDGVLMHQGCTASIKKNTYDSLVIINGSQGMKRIDLIVARYEKNQDNGIESLDLKVIQGTPAESTPTVPEYTEGDIQAGDYVADMPMYQVIIDGLNITEVKKVCEVAPDIDALKKELAELNSKIKNFNTDKTLWSGSVINKNVELSDSIYNFRWIYIETEDGIASPILIRKDKNKYLTGYGYASDSNTIVTVTIKLTINTATNINILSHYADHKFNSGHPNLSAKRVTAIYGVPTYS